MEDYQAIAIMVEIRRCSALYQDVPREDLIQSVIDDFNFVKSSLVKKEEPCR